MSAPAKEAAAKKRAQSGMRRCAFHPRPPESPGGEKFKAITEVRFEEQNAGSGVLTHAVSFRGVRTAKPNDVYPVGTDLRNPVDVEALWESCAQARRQEVSAPYHPLGTSVQLHVKGQAAKLPHTRTVDEPTMGTA